MSEVTELEAYQAIKDRWDAEWPPLRPLVTYCYENQKFVEPTDPTASWARVTLRPLDTVQHTMGGPGQALWLRQSNVWVQLYCPRGVGMEAVLPLVIDVRSIFEGKAFGGLDPAGASRWVPVGSDGRWFEVAVISPVTYYEKH